ncbi:MAG: CDP-glucose 4,6-dehydratase [Afipia sp.]|nr:CDP-glucose 4,6-dehydratase [Afipia sp.]
MIDPAFWRGRRVFLTGHTGFKGAWMALLLRSLGAEVSGFALPPDDERGVFVKADVAKDIAHRIGDIRDLADLQSAIAEAKPDIVIHMAAQSLVRLSYDEPIETYATNVMGTVNLLEAVRRVPGIQATIIVTSDKCYENTGSPEGYREHDPMGGHDPYSSSKGCAELVTSAYRRSFFHAGGATAIASARAGNVIGGGDFARDRLVPDLMRAFMAGEVVRIRNPNAVRPWQHVLDPVIGYLVLAERLVADRQKYSEGWNFGPHRESAQPVSVLVESLVKKWGGGAKWELDGGHHPHEAAYLGLDCSKAESKLGWKPLIGLDQALQLSVDWYRAFDKGADMRELTLRQIGSVLQPRGDRRAS